MGFIFSKMFLGAVLIFWGIVLILEKLLKVNIPMGRFLIAFILIYFGIYIITGRGCSKRQHVRHHRKHIYVNTHSGNPNEYNSIFGSRIVNLTNLKDTDKAIDINTVFGTTEVWLSDNYTYNITGDTVFGMTTLPSRESSAFGTNSSVIGDPANSKIVSVKINTVFGTTDVLIKKGTDATTGASPDVDVEDDDNNQE